MANHLFGCKYASIWHGCQNLSYVKYHVFIRSVFCFQPFSFLFSSAVVKCTLTNSYFFIHKSLFMTNNMYLCSHYGMKPPRLCTYIESTLDNERQNSPKPMRAVYNTPHETFIVALFLICR